MVFKNRVLRKIFRTKREEIIVRGRKLPGEKVRGLYSSPDIRVMHTGFWLGNLK
jgi:hypothetical protein